MNYAIEFKRETFSHLTAMARKRSLKHKWLLVRSGLALIKMGKHEFGLETGQSFWIPQNSLCSLTLLPGSTLDGCSISLRVGERFPQSAGYITLSPLALALFDELPKHPARSDAQLEILAVLKREALQLKPVFEHTPLSDKLSGWTPNSEALDRELHLALLAREAQKRALSGGKKAQIVEDFFDGNEEQCDLICQMLLGQTL
ncbi:AraC family transcriptional regulator [Vibrio sp. 05-20-BW147]|uniref:AraC family transcriptional regulator n=1 Tax=Vibrio sp. 05-20-BW147 TaxID=2575834 RepID=UPI001593225F|nr:AraC family transcriptional regulator [Vibrio sp. 05-20-BW147]NVC63192.1 AraC family transcriptional regulator [Vibrio sp. 05-20-BW147]